MQIPGKVVLITGASEGIGAACASLLSARGAKVAALARSKEKLQGDLAVPADLADPSQRAAAIQTVVERYGHIDILINNAGVGVYQNSFDGDLDAVRRMFEVNLFAPIDLVQRAVPFMKPGSCIVNVSSIAGETTLPWLTLYSASKSALNSFSEGLRTELKPRGIRVMAVCPGYVRTRFQSNILAGHAPDLGPGSRQWSITPEKCAADIVRGIERDSKFVVSPFTGWGLIWLQRLVPSLIQSQFERMHRR